MPSSSQNTNAFLAASASMSSSPTSTLSHDSNNSFLAPAAPPNQSANAGMNANNNNNNKYSSKIVVPTSTVMRTDNHTLQESNDDNDDVDDDTSCFYQQQLHHHHPLSLTDLISFNCGGELITIQRSKVLARFPTSYLANVIQVSADPLLSQALDKDRDGNILLDRDPRLFLCVVNFCRGYRSVGPANDEELEALLVEADYWCIPQLRAVVEEKLGIVAGVITPSPYQKLHFAHTPPPEQVEKMNMLENQELLDEYFGRQTTHNSNHNNNDNYNENYNNNLIDNEIDRRLRHRHFPSLYASQACEELLNSPWCDDASKRQLLSLDAAAEARAKFVLEGVFFGGLNVAEDLRFLGGPGVSTERHRIRNSAVVAVLSSTLPDQMYTVEEQASNREIELQRKDLRLLPPSEAANIRLIKPFHTPADTLVERKITSSSPSSSSCPTSSIFYHNPGSAMVAGVHHLYLEILKLDYFCAGIIPDIAGSANFQQDYEFHRTPGCVAYYHSGVFYSNTPTTFKEENLSKLLEGSVLQLRLDMDNRILEFFVNGNCERMQSVSFSTRVRFAILLKFDTTVSIISPNRAAYLIGRMRAEKMRTQHERLLRESAVARMKEIEFQRRQAMREQVDLLLKSCRRGIVRIIQERGRALRQLMEETETGRVMSRFLAELRDYSYVDFGDEEEEQEQEQQQQQGNHDIYGLTFGDDEDEDVLRDFLQY